MCKGQVTDFECHNSFPNFISFHLPNDKKIIKRLPIKFKSASMPHYHCNIYITLTSWTLHKVVILILLTNENMHAVAIH